MTYLQLINKVLRRLREKQVTVLTSEYALHVGDMINEAKDTVEAAWDWHVQRTSVTFSTVAGTTDYTLTGTTEKSRLLHEKQAGRVQVYNLTDGGAPLARTSHDAVIAELATSPPRARPHQFCVVRGTAGLVLRLSPAPDAVYSIQAWVVNPQAELSVAATVLTVPSDPVWQLALAAASAERGSGMGARAESLEFRARARLGEAIIQDMEPGEMTCYAE